MPEVDRSLQHLQDIPDLRILHETPLSQYTRFAIGGPASMYIETASAAAFLEALRAARQSGLPVAVIGSGTNLIVSDAGFGGVVLRFTAKQICIRGMEVHVEAGADLQTLVDRTIEAGLKGMETLTGIPGSVGAAIYGNAGAYGHSISERVTAVSFHDGEENRVLLNAECEFRYRESVFKRRKDWIVFSAELALRPADPDELRKIAADIRKIRDQKYPPTLKCAGSIFKNLILAELPQAVRATVPERVVREGKVPSAYFLEQVGAKGMSQGDIRVADYHANLIYNAGQGSARDLRKIIGELKARVQYRFGLELEEEVQYVGF
ncbi:MAG TPA: UDP-N-acetylmuramate dehydrogenase [Bryobacteraceae bacterium]|nr:UDP-N-acetylmuramate dehydrogenase [Bryobacteraceae bacterium]